MQRALFQLSIFLLFLALGACGYDETPAEYPTFEKIRDSTDGINRRYFDVIQTSDAKFVAAGLYNTATENFHLLDKFDRKGNLLWSRRLGVGNNVTNEVLELPSGDLLLAGSQFQYGFVMRTDASGADRDNPYKVPNNTKGFAGSSIEAAGLAPDGSVWLFGVASFASNNPDQFFLINLADIGSSFETRFFGTFDAPLNFVDLGSSGLQVSPDGQFVLVATTVRNDFFTPQQGLLLKFPVSGQAPEQKMFEGISLFDVSVSADSKFYFVTGSDGTQVFAAKVSAQDLTREVWSKTYPGQTGQGIVATDDGGAALTGVGNSGSGQLLLLYRLDASGTLMMPQGLFIAGDAQLSDLGQAIIQTPDGFVAAGYTNRTDPDHFAAYLIKADPLGQVNP